MPIHGLDDLIREAAAQAHAEAAASMLEDLRARAPVRTGRLRDSAFGPTFTDTPTMLSAEIGFEVDYAEVVDEGARHFHWFTEAVDDTALWEQHVQDAFDGR